MAWARAPLPEAATAWPAAQARLPRPKASPWSSRCRCGALADQRHGRGEQRAEGGHAHDQHRDEHPRRRQRGRQQADRHRAGQRAPDRHDGAPPVGRPSRDRRQGRLQPGRGQERPRDDQGRDPEAAPSAAARAHPARRTPGPPACVSHSPTPSRRSRTAANASRSPCGTASRGAGTANAAAISTPAATAALANAGPVPTSSAIAPTTGPNSAPPTAAPMAVPIISPRRSGGASVASQAMPAGPGARPAQSLHEPGGVQDRRRRGPPEDQRGDPHERQPEQDGPPVAQVPGEQPARQRPDQGAQRVARHQDPRARLGQVSHVRVMRQQRRQRGEEHRVDQHEHAHEQQQHPQRPGQGQPGSRPFRGGGML